MTRRSAIPYIDALRWILREDDTGWLDFDADEGEGAPCVTASIVADIYGLDDAEVRADLIAERERQAKAG